MARIVALWFVVLLALAGTGLAQEEGPAQPVVSEADVIWQPSVDELFAWIGEGIATAGEDLDFFEMPVLEGMTWTDYDGVPLSGDRAIHIAALMAPELSAYVLGYGAAWDEDTWAAIAEDEAKVAGDLAAELHRAVVGGPMYFPVAVYGAPYPEMQVAVYYQGKWRALEVRPWGTLADYSPGAVGPAMPDPTWAAKYLLAQEQEMLSLQPADEVRVYLCVWARNAGAQVGADFLAELPTPEWTDAKRARLAVGDADLLGWVDFDMVM